ncbi:MAG: 1-(5-phosphoribosyl)-5-[(5-phosphoribosylamino)methylideneamino]imidazole-4-carboxamide isomerase [Sphingomonadaceae bacterium]|nr:1-(5-phosphoribosyl)-5-[(5-phosphoribosylamino)methylideneamino]imidazole-4-carboxamide isomerase [Sphingomonadaceae bacterium]
MSGGVERGAASNGAGAATPSGPEPTGARAASHGFTVWPAIDLKGSKVVRLAEGDMARATVYGDDPAAQALAFAEAGATALHVVDLDGAFAGAGVNAAAVERVVAAFPGAVQVGGGIRSRAAIEGWLARGVARVVLGTAALEDPALVRAAAAAAPGRIVVAVDARGGFVATRGWAEVSTTPIADLARRFEDAGVAAVLFTDVGRDGLLKGVNVAATAALAHATTLPVIASGGVAGLSDLTALRAHANIAGVVVGRALYDGRIALGDALLAANGAGSEVAA